MSYQSTRNDFITNAAKLSFTVSAIGMFAAASALIVDAVAVAVAAASIAFVAFLFLAFVASFTR